MNYEWERDEVRLLTITVSLAVNELEYNSYFANTYKTNTYTTDNTNDKRWALYYLYYTSSLKKFFRSSQNRWDELVKPLL